MDSSKLIVRVAAGVVIAVVAFLLLWPDAKERFSPQPVAAHVAVLVEGADRAVVGPVETAAGTPFTLHAVIEARTRDGATLYYTEAPALEVAGEAVPAGAVQAWDRPAKPEIFWFTVEGQARYQALGTGDDLARTSFSEFFRADWPRAWAIPGSLTPNRDELLADEGERRSVEFGTQRFHVRIEVERGEDDIFAEREVRSVGADALPAAWETFPTVIASLPGPAGPPSSLFGLTQVAPPSSDDGTGSDVAARIAELTERHILFSRASAVRTALDERGLAFTSLAWRDVELGAGIPWGEGGASSGALLRVGDRVVVLAEDAGEPGVLDRGDLCLDFEGGAALRSLGEVFVGNAEGEGLVELARLTGDGAPREDGGGG